MKKVCLKTGILLLALLMILPLAAGCKKKVKDPAENGGENTSDEVTHLVEPKNLGGKEFVFGCSTWYGYAPLDYTDLEPEGYDGEFVNDAAYDRLLYMEEFFNCSVSIQNFDSESVVNKLTQNAMAGSDGFDFVYFRGAQYMAAVNSGSLTELSGLNFNLENPWWDRNSVGATTINNKYYALVGDATINSLLAVNLVAFNKTIVNNFILDNPYELVTNNEWTFSKMVSMAKDIADETLDGESGMSPDDRWGLYYTRDCVQGLLNSCGVKMVEANANGELNLAVTTYTSQIQDILTVLYDMTYAVDVLSEEQRGTAYPSFDVGRVLFRMMAAHNASELRNYSVDYGLLPYPKYTETANYAPTATSSFFSFLAIPKNNEDHDNSVKFLEAFSAQGYQRVRPQFYENMLLRKVGRDEESYDMLKFIFENLTYDPGCVFQIVDGIETTSQDQNPNFSTVLAQRRLIWKSNLETLIESYE